MDEREMPLPIEIFRNTTEGPDYTFLGPTQTCICGSNMFLAVVWYCPPDEEDEPDMEVSRAVAGYFTEMQCVACGALVHGSTDDPNERVGG